MVSGGRWRVRAIDSSDKMCPSTIFGILLHICHTSYLMRSSSYDTRYSGSTRYWSTGVLECSLAVSLAEIFKLPLWVLVPGSIPAPSMQNLRDVPIHTAKTLHQI